jgi:hypothetical protein
MRILNSPLRPPPASLGPQRPSNATLQRWYYPPAAGARVVAALVVYCIAHYTDQCRRAAWLPTF